MAKILLVEDDKSLREIYGVRLMAEGYQIVSAGDGEEALALAIKERPDLIVSDVMMPKISGFDMLDILRSTSETKDVKVIMMTALSSDDQRARGESLGADRYLVKSQVGIEDVVRTVHDVLSDGIGAPAPAPAAPTPVSPSAPEPPAAAPVPAPNPIPTVTPPTISLDGISPAPSATAAPTPPPVAPIAPPIAPAPVPPAAPALPPEPVQTPQPVPTAVAQPVPQFASPESTVPPTFVAPAPAAPSAPAAQQFMPPASNPLGQQPTASIPPAPAPAETLPQPTAPFSTPAPASLGDRVIQPLSAEGPHLEAPSISAQMEQALNTMPAAPEQQPPTVPPAP